MLREILWVLLSVPSALAMAEFFVPGPPPYPTWKIGEVQQIQYRTTYTNYTIALWQEWTDGAELGPILFQTTNGPDQGFDWLVQNYDLSLNTSNKFFLWLFEGSPSLQGNQSVKDQQSSGFFYIDAASTPTNSSSPSPSTTSDGPKATSDGPKATGDVSQNKTSAAGAELSPGAKAGIGVGAGVAVLAILSAILLFIKYRSKKKKEVEELRSTNNYLNSGGPTPSDMSKPVFQSTTVAQRWPFELPPNHDREVAELG